jgi:hypothetical protein
LSCLQDFIKVGQFNQGDLTVLSVDAELLPADTRNQHLALCKDLPRPEDVVVLVSREGTSRSKMASLQQFAPDFRRKYPTMISDVDTD